MINKFYCFKVTVTFHFEIKTDKIFQPDFVYKHFDIYFHNVVYRFNQLSKGQ